MAPKKIANEVYRRSNAKGTRFWSIALEGANVHTGSGSKEQKLKMRTKACADHAAALKHYHKTRVKKLREGFMLQRPWEAVKTGEVVTRVALPHAQMHDYFDAHPQKAQLLVASEQRPMNHEAWLHLVDLEAHTVTEIHHQKGGRLQTFAHRAQFVGSEHALFAVNGRTWGIGLAGPTVEVAADYREGGRAHFNPHCVWPSRSADASRSLLFDDGDVLRVIDGAMNSVFEVSVTSDVVECRAASITHSGRHVVGYFASRSIVYNHEDAASDRTQELRIWNVESKELTHRIPIGFAVTNVGLTPNDEEVIVLRNADGPLFMDLTGKQRFVFDDPSRDDRWQTCYCWAYSPDGSQLALGTTPVRVVQAEDFSDVHILPSPSGAYSRPRQLCFSPAGDVLYIGYDYGEVIGHRVS